MKGPLAASLLLVAMMAACGDDFSRPSEIDKLRVLAIQADPPEVSSPGETQLSALVVGVDTPVTYLWSVCFAPGPGTSGYACLDPSAEILIGADAEPTVQIPDLTAFLESPELEDFDLSLEDGFEALVRLVVEAPGGESLETVKTVLISQSSAPNKNPTLDGVEADGAALDEAPVEVAAGTAIALEPLWADETLEPFVSADGATTETALFSWFAEAGELDRDRSTDKVADNTWTAPALDEGESFREVRLWLVMRDSRGGVDWLERTVRVVP